VTSVRPATEADFEQLPEIERAADEVFADVGITGLPPAASVEALRAAAAVLVAGEPPVGFARVDLVAGEAYLSQLSVHPTAMRRGIGTALLDATAACAAENGHPSIFLATFRDVAWNAPFYARHGFIVAAATTPALQAVARHEDELGMSRFGARVLMRRRLRPRLADTAISTSEVDQR
jgi:GNAT superfamily N-acetyltransferase